MATCSKCSSVIGLTKSAPETGLFWGLFVFFPALDSFEIRFFLLKTDSGYPKDTGVNKPWQPLRIPSAVTPIGQIHRSPPSPIPGDLGIGPSHMSHLLELRNTYGQAQVCSKGHQGSSVDRPCQPLFANTSCMSRNAPGRMIR